MVDVCDCGSVSSIASRYRTVMTYRCPNNTAPIVNYFANPNVSYLGRPTGTDTENNARIIVENMVRLVS